MDICYWGRGRREPSTPIVWPLNMGSGQGESWASFSPLLRSSCVVCVCVLGESGFEGTYPDPTPKVRKQHDHSKCEEINSESLCLMGACHGLRGLHCLGAIPSYFSWIFSEE